MQQSNRKPDLQVAVAQGRIDWADVPANHARFAGLLAQAEGADLVLLPEMFSTGFTLDSASHAEQPDGPTTGWLLEQAARLDAVVCGSLIVQAGPADYRNRLIWARPDGTTEHYDKRHLFRMAGEQNHYTAGRRQLHVELKGWRIRPLLCYDLRFPVWSRCDGTTDLLFYLGSWVTARRDAWNRMLPARAIENLCYVAAVNRIGKDQNDYPHSGDSQVLDYMGNSLLHVRDQQGLFHATLNAAALERFRARFGAHLDADRFTLHDLAEPDSGE